MSDKPDHPENHEPSLNPFASSAPSQPAASPPAAARPSAAQAPARAPRPERRGGNPLLIVLLVSAAFFVIFLAVSGGMLFYRHPGAWRAKGPATAPLFSDSGAVGVIELNGVILDSKKTLKKLESYEDSSDIKGVVLRLNSPGGAVAPSQEIYQKVKNYKKPLVVSMNSVAASGAYYIACGAKKIYANPGTITGSIGVIMEFLNLEKLYEWAKVQRYSIKTGKFKDVGAEYREMTPDEKELLQGMVDDVLSQFKQAVSDGRKLKLEDVTAIADGRIFSGSQAKAAHLVDELGTLQDAVDEVAKEAGIKGKPNVVYYEKAKSHLLDLILDDGSKDDADNETPVGGATGFLDRVARIVTGGQSLHQAITGLEPGIYWIWSGAR